MKVKDFFPVVIIIACACPILADTSFVYSKFDAVIYLPDNWVLEQQSDSQIIFYDQGLTYTSQLSVIRHKRNNSDFSTPHEWTRAHFIAYKLVCETTLNPWGAVLYYDSSEASKQGNLWAPELYCTYFSTDTTIGAWSEYLRFTSSGEYGYELYAMGDTTDMLNNIATYAAILQGIEIPGYSTNSRYKQNYNIRPAYSTHIESFPGFLFDMRGRKFVARCTPAKQRRGAKGIYFTSTNREFVLQLR